MSKYFLSVNVGDVKKYVEVSEDNFLDFYGEVIEKYNNKIQVDCHEDYIIYDYYAAIGDSFVSFGRKFDF